MGLWADSWSGFCRGTGKGGVRRYATWWHLRPVFGARYVVEADGIPSDDVGVHDAAILLDPLRETVALAAHDVGAEEVAFVGSLRRKLDG